jgi:hypothetical protein|tara:strand:+ start:985 stop:1188 length:204 start_codon:yes stop_codon:yes gene_type:complete
MTVVEYDLGYYEGVRNAYRMFIMIHAGFEIEEVLKNVKEEMELALSIYTRTKATEEEGEVCFYCEGV